MGITEAKPSDLDVAKGLQRAADYLVAIVEPLMTEPEAVQVKATTDDRGVLLTLAVAKEDMGRVIGREGETARAIRRLIRQYGLSNNMRVAVRIEEPPRPAADEKSV